MPTFEELHLSPPLAASLTRLGWSPGDSLAREVVPTAARGHNLLAVAPPAPAYGAPGLAGLLSRLSSGGRGLLLAPDTQLDEWAGLAYELSRGTPLRVQVAKGAARIERQLRADAVDLALMSPEIALILAGRSALRTETLTGLLLAWPEGWSDEADVTPLMQDLPKDAQRIVYTADPGRVNALAERYARKALTVGATAGAAPAGPVRTVIVSWSRRATVLSEIVELLDPASLVVWTADRSHHAEIARSVPPGDPGVQVLTGDVPAARGTVIAFDLPTEDKLRQLLEAEEVVLLVPPEAESYVARTAAPRRPLSLPSVRDTAVSAAARRRSTIAARLEQGKLDGALLTLGPLFERHDPAAVAAALLELWTSATPPTVAQPASPASTAKIYVGTGKKDGTTANDLVAVLTKELRVNRTKIGRIELRDAYSLIEIPAQEAETVAAALNGAMVRRRRVTARVDRGPIRKDGKTVRR